MNLRRQQKPEHSSISSPSAYPFWRPTQTNNLNKKKLTQVIAKDGQAWSALPAWACARWWCQGSRTARIPTTIATDPLTVHGKHRFVKCTEHTLIKQDFVGRLTADACPLGCHISHMEEGNRKRVKEIYLARTLAQTPHLGMCKRCRWTHPLRYLAIWLGQIQVWPVCWVVAAQKKTVTIRCRGQEGQ